MIPGIHHVTAIAGDPQANYDFYAGFLGLRLVKKTVNFDDPGTYHFYFGDHVGTPGTIMTFFPWPGAHRGRIGTGQVAATSFAVPAGSLGYWTDRAKSFGVELGMPLTRFGENGISLVDRDGLQLELIEVEGTGREIQGFHSVTLSEEGFERTARLLGGTMAFRKAGEEGNRFRFVAGGGGRASIVDVLCMPDGNRGLQGAGTVHHVAFRTPDDESQQRWRGELAAAGMNVTPVMDRNYFRSIYFREPGGVLFEIATDPPGFAVDEPVEQLGSSLKLPQWYEPMREKIEKVLPKLRTEEKVV
jgi:glyoxalase family protein